jgi:hypothetical protein
VHGIRRRKRKGSDPVDGKEQDERLRGERRTEGEVSESDSWEADNDSIVIAKIMLYISFF